MADPAPIAVVLSAIPVEYQAVQAHLRDGQEERHPAGTIFKLGSLSNSRWCVMLAEMGAGNPQAAIIAERAIRHFQPDLVMLVGIGGRLHTDLLLGDIVVATKIYAIHGGKEGKRFRPRPESWQPDHACDQQARRVAENGTWQDALPDRPRSAAKVYFRPIASGEVVLDAPKSELKRRLDRDYEDAAVIEMEGAGVARACHLNNNVPMMNIRAVSDYAAGKKEGTDRAGWQRRAARNAAAFAVTLLTELPATRRATALEATRPVEEDLLFGTTDQQIVAAHALGSGCHANAVPLLVKGFNAIRDPDVSCRIIWALGELGTEAARDALKTLNPRYDIEQLMIRDFLKAWREQPQRQGDALA